MAISRKAARKLATEANKAGASILGGQLVKDGERYLINKIDVIALLDGLAGQNVLLFLGPVEDEEGEVTKTCLTCGEEYTGPECPRCARVRERLRGS